MLNEQVYATSRQTSGEEVVLEHKGARMASTRRSLARNAQLQTACLQDGSLRVSAPQKWKRPWMRGQPLSLQAVYSIFKQSLFSLTFVFGTIGLAVSRWRSVLIAAAALTAAELVLDGLNYQLLGSSGFAPLPIYGVLVVANFVSYLGWAAMFFLIRQLVLLRAARLGAPT